MCDNIDETLLNIVREENIKKYIFSQKTDKLINHSKKVCEIALEICNGATRC